MASTATAQRWCGSHWLGVCVCWACRVGVAACLDEHLSCHNLLILLPTCCCPAACAVVMLRQVNERISANNPDSCPADCTLPFLSCPPFNNNAKPCSALGVCYNSVGQCACTKGYAGTVCSSCAVGYKRLNGFCVASVVIAPKRMLGVDDGSLLAVVPPPQSMEGGRSAVLGVIFGSMGFVLLGILVQRRVRHKAFLKEYREDVERQARRAA